MKVRPYLNFRGDCQEAIDLYKSAFCTELLEIVRFSDIPQNPQNPISIPEAQKEWILQATLRFGDNFIRMNDCLGELNDPPSEKVSLIVESSIDEVKHAFAVLSEEGHIGMALEETFYSPCTGVVHDKFGVMWILMAVVEGK